MAGVVGDVRDAGLDSAPAPHVYAPLAGVPDESLGENVVGLFRHPERRRGDLGAAARQWAGCCARRCRPSTRSWR